MSSLAYTQVGCSFFSANDLIPLLSPGPSFRFNLLLPSCCLCVCVPRAHFLHFLSFPPYSKQIHTEDPISGLTDDALLVEMQGLLVDLWKETSLLELLIHDLAYGAIGSIGTNDQMADIRRLVHTGHRHFRWGLCNVDHPLARRQPIGGDL